MAAVATQKVLLTLPASLVKRLREAIRDLRSTLTTPGKRFSGDRYLSGLIGRELDALASIPANSAEAEKVLQSQCAPRRLPPAKCRQLNLTLDAQVAARLSKICDQKRIPRNLMMERLLTEVVRQLSKLREIGVDPLGQPDVDVPWSQTLTLDDDDVREREEATECISALADLRGVNFRVAEAAYWKLPPSKRHQLRRSPTVRQRVTALRKLQVEVELTDLLDRRERRTHATKNRPKGRR